MNTRKFATIALGIVMMLGITLGTTGTAQAGEWHHHPVNYAGSIHHRGFPPCLEEDGSTQWSCVWNGHAAGNGIGRSFIVTHNRMGHHARYHYIRSHRAAHLIRVWMHHHCERAQRKVYLCEGWRVMHHHKRMVGPFPAHTPISDHTYPPMIR
jgi:hypothetical protein